MIKPLKTIIATVCLLLIISLMTGCSTNVTPPADQAAVHPSAPPAFIEVAKKANRDVSLALTGERDKKQIRVIVSLNNPGKKAITSVQSWISYNPKLLKGVSIEDKNSAFKLPAPYEQTFDALSGTIHLGRANATPVSDAVIPVAILVFEPLQASTAMLDIYDYREDLGGHASANILVDGIPYNVLTKPASPALIIQK